MKKLYICNRKMCGQNCSFPDCYRTTDVRYKESNPSDDLLKRFEEDAKEEKEYFENLI